MPEPLRLVIRTPAETTLSRSGLHWVHVELAGDRALTIWPGHLPMLGETLAASLRYADAEGEHRVDLPAGIVQVVDSTVNVFLAGRLEEHDAEDASGQFERLLTALIAARHAPGSANARADGPA